MAQLQESTLAVLQQELNKPLISQSSNWPNVKPNFRPPPILPNPNSSVTPFFPKPRPVNRMRCSVEFAEKCAKGLCFWCDEKFEVGHSSRCKGKQLNWIKVQDGDERRKYGRGE